jgi:pimeloyl-ACP methyl ester carboxylesterase
LLVLLRCGGRHRSKIVLEFQQAVPAAKGVNVRRREFITVLWGAGWPLAARAQSGDRVSRISALFGGSASDPDLQSNARVLEQSLQNLSWISRFEEPKLGSFIVTLCVCLVLTTLAYAETLVVLLEGLGGRISSPGIVSLQGELSAIPNTMVALPLAQHNWRDAVKLIKQQKPETKIVVIGYSLGANNATYVAQNVKHVDELIAIQASVWGRATALGENVDKAVEIYNPKFWRTAGLGAKRLRGIHFSYIANSDSHFYADEDPEVRNFVFNEVKKLTDPTAPARSVSGIQPEGIIGAGDMQKVKAAMALLKSESEKLGPAKIEGTDTIDGNAVPAVFFGVTKMNNNFTLVDEVVKEVGGTATIFVKSGADYVRVATNVVKDDASRAIGTVLDPKGKAIEFISMNEAFYGEATILGKPYLTGYEPMHDSLNNIIGIYYFGYLVRSSLTSQEQQTQKR